jgi:hypothetical protein
MASLIDGYNYDVFISYRQKDNRYDGWVSAFVDNLRLELEATFKEDISVYFDMNPLDGLLESNIVDDSLKEKLKCVIFMPVLSQTYCDPKSFAFENEFKRFVSQAQQDKIGLKVNLANGNVALRVLPVRINDLNNEDLGLVESIIGGQLPGIDFIYRSPGVNRPLRQIEDHPQYNLNKTFYRDQINKVAQAIKDIIISVKGDFKKEEFPNKSYGDKEPGHRNRKYRLLKYSAIISAIMLIVFLIFRMGRLDSQEILDKSIAYHDFYRAWDNFEGRLHIATLFYFGDFSQEILEIRTKDNYYKSTSFNYTSRDTIIKGIISGRIFRQVNQNSDPDQNLIDKHNLDSIWIDNYKQHHYLHFGGVMFLKNSGMTLKKKVSRTTFSDRKCLMISFFADSLKNIAQYFNNSTWNVYIDPENFAVLGYKTNKVFHFSEAMIVCHGELIYNGLKIPRFKFVYNNRNDLILVDLFHIEENFK